MSFEVVVGLKVENEELYFKYREKMTPLLQRVGGSFRYDFIVSEVLKSENDALINRAFIICFPDELVMNEFFNNQEYLRVKEEYFEASVSQTTIISSYTRK